MKEIRFRAWDKYRQEFVNPQAYLRLYNHQGNADTAILTPEASNIAIVQSTGLTDRHGKEIYEGDILGIMVDGEARLIKGVVEFGVGQYDSGAYEYQGFFVRRLNGTTSGNALINASDRAEGLEVIGNIYQNPELIERKEQ